MKAVIATTYAEFETRIKDDSGMAQLDSVIAGPVGNRCLLSFHRVTPDRLNRDRDTLEEHEMKM